MNNQQAESAIRGYNVVAGMHVSDSGSVNIHFNGTSSPDAIKPFDTIPFRSDPHFIKRPVISTRVDRLLAGAGQRAALVGLSGVGKSQIAIFHAHEIRRKEPSTFVFWVHASSVARFNEDYQEIAERLRLSGRDNPNQNVLQLVHRWLANENNGPWFMIIDNADDATILKQSTGSSENKQPLLSYIPKTGRGVILVTSQNERAAEMLVGDDSLCPVPVMEVDQAKSLLRTKVGQDLYNDDAAIDLVGLLDCVPLAIVQVACFIKRRSRCGETIETCTKKLQTNEEQLNGLLTSEAPDLRRDERTSKAVMKTWHMTFSQMRRERTSAAELLFFMSFLHSKGIPDSLLKAFYNQYNDGNLEDDIDILIGYALIIPTIEKHTLEMHALIQFSTQTWLSTLDDPEKWRCKYLKVIASEYPHGCFETLVTCRMLHPHIQRAIKPRPTAAEDVKNWASLLHNMAGFYGFLGDKGEAQRMTKVAFETRTKLLGEHHPDTLSSMRSLASVKIFSDSLHEAEVLLQQAIKAHRRWLGYGHPKTLAIMDKFATLLQLQGNYSEAEATRTQTLMMHLLHLSSLRIDGSISDANVRNNALKMQELGLTADNVLTSMSNLASLSMDQGRGEDALRMNLLALEIRTRAQGEYHPDTLNIMFSQMMLLNGLERYTEAEALCKKTLGARTKVLGKGHPDTLQCVNILAQIYWFQNRKSEARQLLRLLVIYLEEVSEWSCRGTQNVRELLEKWERSV